jgi:signal transduction histidine kinase/ligand-binding sensor domain-containing protein
MLSYAVFTASNAAAQEMRFRLLGLDDGLPQSYVNQITQDVRGYLWIGTQDGLASFDGRRMTVYRHVPGDATSIAGNNVHALCVGEDSLLYANTANGPCRFDDASSSWSRVASSQFPTQRNQQGLRHVHDGTVNVTYTDRLGRVWVGSVRDGLSVTDPRTPITHRFSARERGNQQLPSDDVWALCEDARGRMWVGLNGGGLVIVDAMRITHRLTHVPSDPTAMSSNVIRFLFEDNHGTMWIGTHGGGMCQYDPYRHAMPLLQPTRRAVDAQDNFIRGIASDGKGVVYIGLRTGVLITDTLLASSRMLVSWRESYTQNGAARALHIDAKQQLWIGSERNGLGLVAPGSQRVRWISESDNVHPNRRTVSCIVADGPEHILLGTDDGVARIHVNTLRHEWYDVPTSPMPNDARVTVSAIVRLASGDVLLGTEFGLYRGQLGGTWKKIDCPDTRAVRPNIDIIRSIDVRDQTVYVATWGGGVRCVNMNTGVERVIDARIGLPNNTTYAAYSVGVADLVISTNAGVVIWDRNTHRMRRQLTPQHGAQSMEFNSWSHHRQPSGTLFLGGINGVNALRISDLVVPPRPTAVMDAEQSADGIMRYIGRAIALSTVVPIIYRVTLIGADTVQFETSSPEIITSTLAPGAYTLTMEAAYQGSVYGNAVLAQFIVPTPLWQTWWFYAGMVLSCGGAVWYSASRITRKREQRKHEQERLVHQERVRIARDLHDDVGTGLAKIVIMAENAVAEPDRDVVQSIADTAQDVIDSVRSIVWVMKAHDQRIAATIGYVQLKINELVSNRGMSFTYDESLSDDTLLDPITMRNVVLASQEIATNIVRHSKATHVVMYVRDTNAMLTIDVRDNGTGFDASTKSSGSGLANIRERMHEIHGTCAIESSPETGTRIVLSIPLANM